MLRRLQVFKVFLSVISCESLDGIWRVGFFIFVKSLLNPSIYTCLLVRLAANSKGIIHGLHSNDDFSAYNLGNENGFSVFDGIQCSEYVVRKKVEYEMLERRHGDPSSLVANSSSARENLSWDPLYGSLENIILSAWNWHKK